MILSALYPRFRDLAIIWAVFSTALLYATPVLYPLAARRAERSRISWRSIPWRRCSS